MDTQISDVNSNPRVTVEHKEMLAELREQNFDVIRFATYRTGCKLRFIQKKTNLYLVDIWNIIEASRENGLNTLEHNVEVNVSRLEMLLSSIFYQLNKRLPSSQQIKVDICISLLLNWLLSAYDRDSTGKIKVFSIKVALATLCAGKLMDKFRYIFSQISDSNGLLIMNKCDDYLKEVLALPTAVNEEPSFGFSEGLGRSIFNGRSKVTVNDFLDTLMSDPGPQCMMWLPVLHRMASVENVYHPIHCDGCHRESFTGFRYKCQRCPNYHLCQDCFWRGRTSGSHSIQHEMKEYTAYKTPAKQLSHSIRKSFRCVPTHPTNDVPHFPDTPEKTLDLSHIVPPTPTPIHNGFHEASLNHSFDLSSIDSRSATKSPSKLNSSLDCSRIDDEHRLIARYAARLAVNVNNAARSPSELSLSVDASKEQRELIAQLESKNREIMREIQRLRKEQEMSFHSPSQQNPTLLAELRALRQRKDELEMRMAALQESRRELMVQLEGLMKLLKNHQASPRSTPNSSPRSGSAKSPPIPPPPVARSTPTTPADSLSGVGGDVKQAFGQSVTTRSLRNDLLVAADSVTNAMSSLVKELNSEDSGDDDDEDGDHKAARDSRDLETEDTESNVESLDGGNITWREEVQKHLAQESEFMAELQARKLSASQHKRTHYNSDSKSDVVKKIMGQCSYCNGLLIHCKCVKLHPRRKHRYVPEDGEFIRGDNDSYVATDDGESYIRTDDESYIRTDDEDHEVYEKERYVKRKHTRGLYMRNVVTDDGSYVRTDDDESCIKTDDDEGGNADWEDAMKRWVNR